MPERFGAFDQEWTFFDLLLGLTQDLLPVVSNPHAPVSAQSAIKQKGKVPSRYNGRREMVGFPAWTKYQATGEDINQWSREKDYGICLQTRHVRALDIDVEHSAEILGFIERLDRGLPKRFRAGSGKCLFAFQLPGAFSKRILPADGGIIEFLGTGQQFIAAGTHPSGTRYEWERFTEFPVLSETEFEELWAALVERFAVAPAVGKRARREGTDLGLADETLSRLTVLAWGPQGQAHIECPFAAQHTAGSGESATSYFPRGTGGYAQGHFVCLHAHCAGRADEEFLDALGLRAAEFEKVALPAIYPKFKRTRNGEIEPVVDNLYRALKRDDVCSARIAYDQFRDEVVITSAHRDALTWRPLTDNDYTVLQRHLEGTVGFKPIALDLLRRTVGLVAYENGFDSAILWLEGLSWDGVPRVEKFMSTYMSAQAGAYTRAVSLYLWSALAGRVLVPGIKADMVPIWESPKQGRIKSTTIEAMAPDPEFFLEVDLGEKETDLTRKMRGKLIAEINELRGLQTRDAQSINAFITRRFEEWVPKYVEKSKRMPRRLIFIGTTNLKEILGDETGHRRWLPTEVGFADIESIVRDRDQLWAESREIFRKRGICWQDAQRLAPDVHKNYEIQDPWSEVVISWLKLPEDVDGNTPLTKGYITTTEVMSGALHIETRNMKGLDARRIGKILRREGLEHVQKRVGGRTQWVWVPSGGELL